MRRKEGKQEDAIWSSFATYFDSRNVISSCVVFSSGSSSFNRCTHTISVILTHKDTWKIPQFGHIVGFKHLQDKAYYNWAAINGMESTVNWREQPFFPLCSWEFSVLYYDCFSHKYCQTAFYPFTVSSKLVNKTGRCLWLGQTGTHHWDLSSIL